VSGDWNLIIPPRGDNEPDSTVKQRGFIRGLFDSIGSDHHKVEEIVDLDSLGITQASALIDQLINIRDNGPNGPAPKTTSLFGKIKRAVIITILIIFSIVIFAGLIG
jgi:hypothetical protein